uniref:Uncharacterized protein n=1 Tax=Mus musculus TaxID=10090 RepID=Q3TQU1_MOUSE|nr:unnamed protein product [Mus musculus]
MLVFCSSSSKSVGSLFCFPSSFPCKPVFLHPRAFDSLTAAFQGLFLVSCCTVCGVLKRSGH